MASQDQVDTMEILEDKDSPPDLECCLDPDDDDDTTIPSVKLNEAINLRDLQNEGGTMFEVQENPDEVPSTPTVAPEVLEPDHVTSDMNSVVYGNEEEGNDENEELSPFQSMAKTMENVTPDGGVKKQVLQHGIGAVVPPGSLVRVHYSGRLEYADEPFDSSYLQFRNRPRAFKLGDGQWVAGLDIAVGTMKRKETAMFLIAPKYFFGELGCPPRIPPKATVLFRVELESFSDRTEVNDYYCLSREERKNAPMSLIMSVVDIEKKEGNEFFNNRIYVRAMRKYRKAIDILEECHLADAEAEKMQREKLFKIYTNAALCAIHLGEAGRILHFSNRALDINSTAPKPWYLKGKGLCMQGEFNRAQTAFKRAQHLGAKSHEISKALQDLETKLQQFKEMEKETCMRMFHGLAVDDKEGKQKKENQPPAVRDETVDKLSKVSDEFRNIVRTQLQDFMDNPTATVLPFQSARYSLGEIHCLVETADDMGLHIQQVGEGSNLHYRFSKVPVDSQLL